MPVKPLRRAQDSAHRHSPPTAHPAAHGHAGPVTAATLQAHGLRSTRARLEVYRLLVEAGAPLSHTEVTGRLKSVRDRVTLYRALDALVAHGLVHTVSFPDRKRRFAACLEHSPQAEAHSDRHAHFICNNCEATLCVGRKDTLLAAVQRWLPKPYAITGMDVLLYGLCPRCKTAR